MSEYFRPEISDYRESKEIASASSEWAGGFFETAGSFYFDTQFKGSESVFIVPVISYRDNSDSRLDELHNILGGSINRNSQKWSVRNNSAVELATKIEPYAPAREHQIDIFSHILELPHEERKQIVKQFQKEPRLLPIPADAYSELVTSSEFLAGVYDGHGMFQIRADRSPIINISSQNLGLLEAIQKRFGGSVHEEMKNRLDTPVAPRIREIVPSYRITMSYSQVDNFFDDTHEDISLRKDDLIKYETRSQRAA